MRRNPAIFLPLGVALFIASPVAPAQITTRLNETNSGVQSNGGGAGGDVSENGRFVVFEDFGTNLDPNDTNGVVDVYLRDRLTGWISLQSLDSTGAVGNGGSFQGVISGNGAILGFSSTATNFAPNDTNGFTDAFVRDWIAGTLECISVTPSGVAGDGSSMIWSMSRSGRLVAFSSTSTNLVAGDANGVEDVFVRNRATGVTERVSVDASGVEGNGISNLGSISADGRYVAFQSQASNLVAGDTNGFQDIFVHDRRNGTNERVSVDSAGIEANDHSQIGGISPDGNVVVFQSWATNLVTGDTNGMRDVFVHDRTTGATERVCVSSSGAEAIDESEVSAGSKALSLDGSFVTFRSFASNLVAGDTNGTWDVFVRDRVNGVTKRVSVDSAGVEGNASSYSFSISENGQIVTFWGFATNLVTPDANGVQPDVFAHGPLPATWSNYGTGFPGTAGVPSLAPDFVPAVGSSFQLELGNSLGASTFGLVLAGTVPASIPTSKGGTILVDNVFFTFFLPIPAAGVAIPVELSTDSSFYGVSIFVQAIELDAGAAKGLSFTPGLELVLGDF